MPNSRLSSHLSNITRGSRRQRQMYTSLITALNLYLEMLKMLQKEEILDNEQPETVVEAMYETQIRSCKKYSQHF